jgi:hypothetical protein
MTAGPGIGGSQDITSEAGDWFWLSRDFTNSCCTWDPGVTHTACQSGSFPYRVYIDLSHRDTLRYEWPLVRCSHLIVFMLCYWWLEDDDGYSYIIITITVSTLLWRWHGLAFCLFMHVLVFRCKHNTWLIKMAKIMKAKDHMLVVVSLVPSNPSALHV